MIQHIGEDFSSSIELDLLPGIMLPPGGIWQINLMYFTSTAMHHVTYNMMDANLRCVLGRDVYSIKLQCFREYFYMSGNSCEINLDIRVDRLILLNLVCKLLNTSIDINEIK